MPTLSILKKRRLERLVDRLVLASRDQAALNERVRHLAEEDLAKAREAYPRVLAELGLARLALDKFIKELSE